VAGSVFGLKSFYDVPALITQEIATKLARKNITEALRTTEANFDKEGRMGGEQMGITTVIPHRDNWCNEDPKEGDSQAVFEWSVKQAQECDVTIAQVGEPSLGTGGELMAAHAAGKAIILMSPKGNKVSRFVKGMPSVVYHVEYEDQETAMRQLKNVLKQL
jgi:nucleoside 2-deoxyribosyltransferase